MRPPSPLDRRRFLRGVAGTAALLGQGAASARPASSPLRRAPNDELRIGVVGVGRRGVDHVASLGYPTPDERDRYEVCSHINTYADEITGSVSVDG